jgi:hypothetical protein
MQSETRKSVGDHAFGRSIVVLLAHLAGTALVFATLFTLIWATSWFLACLQAVHALPDEVLRPIHFFEIGALYLDEAICAIMLVAGATRFCGELLGRSR